LVEKKILKYKIDESGKERRCEMDKNTWIKQEFEIKEQPEDGEKVQYAVLHILQLQKFNIPMDVVNFFMREVEGE